jgi:MFS family permease
MMRPVGAAVFGRYSDLRGRKPAMLVAVMGVGLVTASFGALPTPQIGTRNRPRSRELPGAQGIRTSDLRGTGARALDGAAASGSAELNSGCAPLDPTSPAGTMAISQPRRTASHR